MKKFELQFPSFLKLWEFLFLTYARQFRISIVKRTLICHCTETEVELAVHAFKARVKALY